MMLPAKSDPVVMNTTTAKMTNDEGIRRSCSATIGPHSFQGRDFAGQIGGNDNAEQRNHRPQYGCQYKRPRRDESGGIELE